MALTFIMLPILVVWLFGTLLLAERRAGHIIMLVGSLLALLMPVAHLWGPGEVVKGEFAKSAGAFFFVWTLMALGVTGMFSFILSVRGLWSLRTGPATVVQQPEHGNARFGGSLLPAAG